jgi:two-component system, OmpR family, sensor histidine kinase VicK
LNNLFHDSSNTVNDTILDKTEVVYGIENIVARAIERWKNTQKKMDSCIDRLQPRLLVTDKTMFSELVELVRKDLRTRTIFEITEENVIYVKELMELIKPFGKKHIIRHLDNVIGNFSISDGKIFQSHVMGDLSIPNQNNREDPENQAKQKEFNIHMTAAATFPQCILSDVHAFVEQQQNIFELMWQKAISAEQRIKEIEFGIEPEVIETIKDKEETQNLLFGLLESAKEEVLVIFSTSNEFHRQNGAGFFKVVKKVKEMRPWINIRILTPKDNEIESIKDKEFCSFNIVFVEPLQRVSVLVVDRKYSLTIELKDDTKQHPSPDAIGLASYSNSLPTVLSYISVFETLLKQTELLEQLKDHDKIQQEFINIAAHELRNPIQPILGLSEILIRKKDKDQKEMEILQTINKNAKRLQKLTEDILDVTRIESKFLVIHKETLNLNDFVLDSVKNYERSISNKDKDIKFKYDNFNRSIIIEADKNRLNQVIANLISNSVKFIDKKVEGVISISINIRKIDRFETVVIDIQDNGIGIFKEIMPKLFTKFASKSFQGTGLGLYISKKIIEAHGGEIWAQNNEDGKGATFSFSIPLPERYNHQIGQRSK